MADLWKPILARMRAAVDRYHMIAPGDAVAVGVSGGKDSLVLLEGLARMQRFYPAPYSLIAITLDPVFDGIAGDYGQVTALCERLGVPHIIKRTALWEVVFQQRQEANPCSLCARMRRGALHLAAQQAGCGVVALGHHRDDAAETFLMNLLKGGAIGAFSPKSYLDRRDLRLIRPLIFLSEKEVARCARAAALPVVPSRCPADGCTQRQRAKEQIAALSREYGDVNEKILHALQKAGLDGW